MRTRKLPEEVITARSILGTLPPNFTDVVYLDNGKIVGQNRVSPEGAKEYLKNILVGTIVTVVNALEIRGDNFLIGCRNALVHHRNILVEEYSWISAKEAHLSPVLSVKVSSKEYFPEEMGRVRKEFPSTYKFLRYLQRGGVYYPIEAIEVTLRDWEREGG